jgi:hypothetical protein
MVPFSFHQALLKSRVMKERSLPSVTLDPIGGESRDEREGCERGSAKPHLTHFPQLGPWCRSSTVTLVWQGKAAALPQFKNLPYLPRLPSKTPKSQMGRMACRRPQSLCCHDPNFFPETQLAPVVLYFLSVPIDTPWLKKTTQFQAI